MTIYQLQPKQIETFAGLPEVDMGVQVAMDETDNPLVIACGRVAIRYNGNFEGQFESYREIVGFRRLDFSLERYGERLETWVRTLPNCPPIMPMPPTAALAILPFIHLGPRGVLPPPPWRPPFVYGHLPFHGLCSGGDFYYRYEQFPNSLRITGNTVTKPDTYAAPESERDFTPTGLSAVGRFALPSLLPACWRYELTPVSGTRIFYGASVPLYGQSGGAVEVMFPDPFTNTRTIPPPTVLPIL
jgi:hypothetical protein